jgi:hypothetical protein
MSLYNELRVDVPWQSPGIGSDCPPQSGFYFKRGISKSGMTMLHLDLTEKADKFATTKQLRKDPLSFIRV